MTDGDSLAKRAPLRLDRVNGLGAHDDLLLHLGAYEQTFDSCSLTNDCSTASDEEIADGLAQMLGQWVIQLRRLVPGGVGVFLPFDITDQGSTWLLAEREDGERVVLQAGWSALNYWRVDARDLGSSDIPGDFRPIAEAKLECRITDLIATLVEQGESFSRASRRRRP